MEKGVVRDLAVGNFQQKFLKNFFQNFGKNFRSQTLYGY